MRRSKNNPHYSYSIYANSATAEQFDDSHFGGPIGQLIVEMQEHVLFDFLGDVHNASVLISEQALGARLWQLQTGAHVTGVDASAEMLKVAQKHAEDANLDIKFFRGDAHSLDFPDRSCDVAVSLRMLMHTPDWRRCIAEMCHVAHQRVIFDYPPSISFAALQTITRKAAQLARPPRGGVSCNSYRLGALGITFKRL